MKISEQIITRSCPEHEIYSQLLELDCGRAEITRVIDSDLLTLASETFFNSPIHIDLLKHTMGGGYKGRGKEMTRLKSLRWKALMVWQYKIKNFGAVDVRLHAFVD